MVAFGSYLCNVWSRCYYEAAIGFKETHEAVVVILPPFAMLHSKRIVDLPAYGLSIGELYRRAAVYMDKILKGQGPEIYRSSSRPSSSSSSIWRAAKQIGLLTR
jgi:hypothetical protein